GCAHSDEVRRPVVPRLGGGVGAFLRANPGAGLGSGPSWDPPHHRQLPPPASQQAGRRPRRAEAFAHRTGSRLPFRPLMDQTLLRSYLATVYEFPTESGVVRASLDGEMVKDESALPPLLRTQFAILTAYNPRSMLLPRRVNDGRHQVMRDLLILG